MGVSDAEDWSGISYHAPQLFRELLVLSWLRLLIINCCVLHG